MVEKVVPLHHIISIFQSILHHDQTIPSLFLPSNFVLNPPTFAPYFNHMKHTLQQEHVEFHLVTQFMLLFHNHPMITQFLLLQYAF